MDSENKETSLPEQKSEHEATAPLNDPLSLYKRKQKKRAIAFISVILALLVILPIITFIDWQSVFKSKNSSEDEDFGIEFYGDRFFSAPNYDEDIEADEEYMGLSRSLYYTFGNETVEITDDATDFGKNCELFYNYFEIVKSGRSEDYYSLFTEKYIEKVGSINPFTKKTFGFTPQKLYNINVRLLKSQFLENGDANGEYVGCTVYYYDVEYYIKDNNGTFRRDILSDESRPLVFEILEENGVHKISNISFYKTTD